LINFGTKKQTCAVSLNASLFDNNFAPLAQTSPKSNDRTRLPLLIIDFLPECHYVRVFAIANPSVVCRRCVTFVRPTHGVETFGNISLPLCTLAILWPPCKILWRSSQGNPSVWGVKHKRGSKIERCGPIEGYIS